MGTFPAVYCANKAISGNPGYPAICERSESKSQYVRLAEAGRTEFHCENGMVLARRPHFTESDGISRRLGTSDSGSRMISTTMQAGERVSRYEADRSVMENTDP